MKLICGTAATLHLNRKESVVSPGNMNNHTDFGSWQRYGGTFTNRSSGDKVTNCEHLRATIQYSTVRQALGVKTSLGKACRAAHPIDAQHEPENTVEIYPINSTLSPTHGWNN